MGLFSKKEDKKKETLPPPPKPMAAEQNSNDLSSLKEPSADVGVVPPPVLGAENLNEIKKEVESEGRSSNFPQNNGLGDVNLNGESINNQTENGNLPASNSSVLEENSNLNESSNLDESLFSLDDLDLGKASGSSTELSSVSDDSIIDTNVEKKGDLEFLEKEVSRKAKLDEPLFITTTQFKNMMEIIENIKLKVKESSETHLRLMDIKSEEDIEYENLRKSFQYFEEKLYELDNLLFEK